MPPRAVADTNVLVAAAIAPRATCGRLLALAGDGAWELVASPKLLAELTVVLHRQKFRRWLSRDEADQFIADVRALADVVADPPPSEVQMTADLKDDYLVVLAQAADVVALISGDPHLTDLTDLEPPVLTPAVFLKQFQP